MTSSDAETDFKPIIIIIIKNATYVLLLNTYGKQLNAT